MADKDFDVVIVGAGPAGCAAAYSLRNSGLRVALIDQSTFPRDKICGDALSVDIANQLEWMDPQLSVNFDLLKHKQECAGVKIYSPSNHAVVVPIWQNEKSKNKGYICERLVFDQWFFEQVNALDAVQIYTGTKVTSWQRHEEGISLSTNQGSFSGQMIIAADGANSMFRDKSTSPVDKSSYAAGLRQYFEQVTPSENGSVLELFFLKGILPGYFWIFPLPDDKFNVGMGMLSKTISDDKISLKTRFENIIQSHPDIAPRFKQAKSLESVKGFPIPLGKTGHPISSDRILFVGDAGSLVEPFSGEGVANALRSGRFAARHVTIAIQEKRFSAADLKEYDEAVYAKVGKEFTLARALQRMSLKTRLFDYLVYMAERKSGFTRWIAASIGHPEKLQQLLKPSFWFRLPFRKRWNS